MPDLIRIYYLSVLMISKPHLTSTLFKKNVSSISNYLLSNSGQWDEMWVYYNEFINSISTKIKRIELMNRERFVRIFKLITVYDVSEPEPDFSAHHYYELYVASQLYHALLQNNACEQSARMNAMENASKNAGEILDALTITYNNARQSRITMELVEIISGANAL